MSTEAGARAGHMFVGEQCVACGRTHLEMFGTTLEAWRVEQRALWTDWLAMLDDPDLAAFLADQNGLDG